MDTFTNSTPSAKYLAGSGMVGLKTSGASVSAAIVMAAGSVINEPANGTATRPSQATATVEGIGRRSDTEKTARRPDLRENLLQHPRPSTRAKSIAPPTPTRSTRNDGRRKFAGPTVRAKQRAARTPNEEAGLGPASSSDQNHSENAE